MKSVPDFAADRLKPYTVTHSCLIFSSSLLSLQVLEGP